MTRKLLSFLFNNVLGQHLFIYDGIDNTKNAIRWAFLGNSNWTLVEG